MSLWMPRASKMDAAGDQADIAKTNENHWFSRVWGGWRVIVEAWGSSGPRCWHTGWQKAGWLEGWLVVAGAGWQLGWAQVPQELKRTTRERPKLSFWGAQNRH